MSPRTSHLVAWHHNQWLPGGHMFACFSVNVQMDHSVLFSTLPCPLSEFPFVCFLLRVANRVAHLFVAFLFHAVRFVVSSLLRCAQWLATRACLDWLLLAQKFGHMRAAAFACRSLCAWQGFCCHFPTSEQWWTEPSSDWLQTHRPLEVNAMLSTGSLLRG